MTKEEKDKLIELSDLNREDNIKYISSEAQGIAITLDMDRYAPTFCKLERAYICGRRKSEKQIEELEKENTELTETLKTYNGCGDWDNDFHTCRVYLQHEELQEYIDQLTKAKEIIKEFVCHYNNKTIYVENMNPLLQRAEQFIKGCSE